MRLLIILMAACLCSIPVSALAANQEGTAMIQESDFGKTPDGASVKLYTLTNKNGMVAKVMTYGATLVELHVPDKSGKMADVVLGLNNLPDYLEKSPFFGATAGRYANRIADAQFTLNGHAYHLFANDGANTLHGGKKGFDKQIWKATPKASDNGASVQFQYRSADGEEGFPGNLQTTCTYTLGNDNSLKIEFTATTDKPTVVNLANHSYFNLGGESSGSILDEILMINADRYTPVNAHLIPTGQLAPVKNTPFDFTHPMPIGSRIRQVPGGPPNGYDHNYVLNGPAGKLSLCARVKDPKSGRVMEVLTTQPGVQFYTGNFLNGKVVGIGGKAYNAHDAFCLETQHFPDSPHQPSFPTTVLLPGQKYDQVTVFKFSAE